MHLAFSSQGLRDLCQLKGRAQEEWGDAIAAQLRHRLADLEAANTPLDLAPIFYKFVGQGVEQRMILRLIPGHCLIVSPNASYQRSGTDIVWQRVARVQITGVEVCDEWNT